MPTRPPRPCSRCGAPAVAGGKCERHKAQQLRRTEQQRGDATERGYATRGHRDRFRAAVLRRDNYTCQMCGGVAEVADHFPLTRRELLAAGQDADNPDCGRALCAQCHNRHTALSQTNNNLQQR